MALARFTNLPFDEPRSNKIYIQKSGDVELPVKDIDVPEDTGRDQWGGKAEFLLACLGNAVGEEKFSQVDCMGLLAASKT